MFETLCDNFLQSSEDDGHQVSQTFLRSDLGQTTAKTGSDLPGHFPLHDLPIDPGRHFLECHIVELFRALHQDCAECRGHPDILH